MRLRLLLDTHAWVWRLLDPERLSHEAEQAIRTSLSELFLSPISVWETLVLARRGRLALDPSPGEWVLEALRRSALRSVPVTHEIAIRSERLGGFDVEDPADRFLVATALEHELTLVTADRAMHRYDAIATVW